MKPVYPRTDTERLDWIIEKQADVIHDDGELRLWLVEVDDPWKGWEGRDLRDTIDEAMLRSSKIVQPREMRDMGK